MDRFTPRYAALAASIFRLILHSRRSSRSLAPHRRTILAQVRLQSLHITSTLIPLLQIYPPRPSPRLSRLYLTQLNNGLSHSTVSTQTRLRLRLRLPGTREAVLNRSGFDVRLEMSSDVLVDIYRVMISFSLTELVDNRCVSCCGMGPSRLI